MYALESFSQLTFIDLLFSYSAGTCLKLTADFLSDFLDEIYIVEHFVVGHILFLLI